MRIIRMDLEASGVLISPNRPHALGPVCSMCDAIHPAAVQTRLRQASRLICCCCCSAGDDDEASQRDVSYTHPRHLLLISIGACPARKFVFIHPFI